MSKREAINLRLEALVICIYCFCLFRDSLYQTSSDWITVTQCTLVDASKEDVGKSVNRLLLSQTPPCSYFFLLFQCKRETVSLWTQSESIQENKWVTRATAKLNHTSALEPCILWQCFCRVKLQGTCWQRHCRPAQQRGKGQWTELYWGPYGALHGLPSC